MSIQDTSGWKTYPNIWYGCFFPHWLRESVSPVFIYRVFCHRFEQKHTITFLRFLNLDLHQVSNKLWSPVLTQYYGSTFHTYYIRKEKYRHATTPAAAAAAAFPMYVTLRGPPWILKRAGLESSGKRFISLICKTRKMAFFGKKM